jgi:dTDP-4-dehydrorhamnose reductase
VAGFAVIGAGGVLGAKLVEQSLLQTHGPVYAFTHGSKPIIHAVATSRATWLVLELADSLACADAISRAQPDTVINCAAMTDVDGCELHRDAALLANAAGPANLAGACVQAGARLIHVSTDYVFPGDDAEPGPYLEDAPVRPINYYGWTKRKGELAVQQIAGDRVSWLVVRTALVYGHIPGGRTNFVKWLLSELRAGRRVKVVNDQINTPTVADDLATVLLHLAQAGSEGVIHVAGPDLLTRYEWARVIASSYGLDEELIDVISTAELNQLAKRPLRSGLRTLRSNEWKSVHVRGVHEGLSALDIS